MVEKRRYRFNRNEVKTGIIEFVLDTRESVGEPIIRKHLKEVYGVVDQGTVNRHLHDLEESDCIELIPPKKGLRNYWEINKIENLNNIKLNFPKIQLNLYRKSLNVLLQERDFHPCTKNTNRFRAQLFFSPSLFDMYLKNGINTLYTNGYELYKTRFFDEYQDLENSVHKVYSEFVARVCNDPSRWSVVVSEHSEGVSEPGADQNFAECSNHIFIPEESFRRLLEEAPTEVIGEIYNHSTYRHDLCLNIMAFMSNLLSQEIYKEMQKATPALSTRALNKVLISNAEEILTRVVKDPFYELAGEIAGIYNVLRKIKLVSINDAFFEHCFERDILSDNASEDEKDFMYIIKKNHAGFEFGKPRAAIQTDNKFYIYYYEKCMSELEKARKEVKPGANIQ